MFPRCVGGQHGETSLAAGRSRDMIPVRSLHDRISDRIATEVSPSCMHRLPTGECEQPEGLPCPIHSNIDRIIGIVRSVSSDRIDSYVERLGEEVCKACGMQDEFGECRLRNQLDCCLDAFFVLVVRIVEEEIERGEEAD